jgi:hypothetical protein
MSKLSVHTQTWRAAVTALLLAAPVSGSWLSDITGIDINVPRGTIQIGRPNPAAIPQMIQNLPKDVGQFFLNPAGGAVAFAIRQAKEQYRYGCQPMPISIRETLARFYPPELMNGVCYALYDPRRVGLNSILMADFNTVSAVTLEDVIVFRNAQGDYSASDPILWAHELMHVIQYRRLGLETFAHLYSFRFQDIENEASNMERLVRGQLQNSAQPRFWQTTGDWNTAGTLETQVYATQARQAINPLQCSGWSRSIAPNGQPVLVEINNCPIPIRVLHFVAVNRANGVTEHIPCQGNECYVPPGAQSTFPDATSHVFQTFHIGW